MKLEACTPVTKNSVSEPPPHAPQSLQLEKSLRSNEDPAQPKINTVIKTKKKKAKNSSNAASLWPFSFSYIPSASPSVFDL